MPQGTTNFGTVKAVDGDVWGSKNVYNAGQWRTHKSGTKQITGANATVTSGLASIFGWALTPVAGTATLANRCLMASASVSAGNLIVRRYKQTSAGTSTLIASTATSSIRWEAWGKL